jgi:hypothetical protein
MKKYVTIIFVGSSTAALLKFMGLLPFGNTEGFLVIGFIHMAYYHLIVEMSHGTTVEEDRPAHVVGPKRPPKPKVGPIGQPKDIHDGTPSSGDIVTGLINLGLSKKSAQRLLYQIRSENPKITDTQQILKLCLQQYHKNK